MKGRAGWDSSQCGAAGESRPAQDKITMMTVWEKKKSMHTVNQNANHVCKFSNLVS